MRSLAIAATLFAFAPVLDVFLLVLFPLTAAEARYHGRMVELQHVDTLSHETVRQTLKKTCSSRT